MYLEDPDRGSGCLASPKIPEKWQKEPLGSCKKEKEAYYYPSSQQRPLNLGREWRFTGFPAVQTILFHIHEHGFEKVLESESRFEV